MNDLRNAPFIRKVGAMASNMYRLGWNERNGGNISLLLSEDEIKPYKEHLSLKRILPLMLAFPELEGKYFLVSGTGKYFKNIVEEPEENLGIIHITNGGSQAELLWGYSNGGSFTSEIYMHLGAHKNRLASDSSHRVVIHAHPTKTVSMTHIHSIDEREFTRTLWQMCTECVVIFPDGVAVLPWMVSSSPEIGVASAEKFKDFRILVWALHGCTVVGSSLDEAFGLMETVEKAADIYMNIATLRKNEGIDDKMLREVAQAFNLEVREGWL